jgi:cell division protein FtsQ
MKRLTRSEVLALAAVPPRSTLIRADTSDIEERLEASPWVRDATVDRDFPHTLRLTVNERRPAAIADAGGTNLWVVASDGYWLGRRSARDTDTVVVRDIEGLAPRPGRRADSKELRNAVKIAAGLSDELRGMTRAISAPTIEKTALITEDDVEIFIGPATQLAAKDRIAREILKSKKGEVVYINVRVVDSPIWRGLDE